MWVFCQDAEMLENQTPDEPVGRSERVSSRTASCLSCGSLPDEACNEAMSGGIAVR